MSTLRSKILILLELNVVELGKLYKSREVYSRTRIKVPLAIRLDGVGFGRALSSFEKPRSRIVHEALVEAAKSVLEKLGCTLAYVVSDELNIMCLEPHLAYSGRVEKVLSISAGVASSAITLRLGKQLFFDSRIIHLESLDDAEKYILYRARIGLNNYISQLYHMVIGARKSTPRLMEMIEELKQHGVNVYEDEEWKLLGSCITRKPVTKEAVNRLTGEKVVVTRRRWIVEDGPWACIREVKQLAQVHKS